jgi:hypothetical protein
MAKGGVKINDHTARVVKDVERFSLKGLEDYVDRAQDIATKMAPVAVHRGGNHRSMIFSEPRGAGFVLGSGSGYGGYLELGTSKMVARPHFQPGIDQARREFEDGGRWNK